MTRQTMKLYFQFQWGVTKMNYFSRMFAYAVLCAAAAFGSLGCGDSGVGGGESPNFGQDEDAAIMYIIDILDQESFYCSENISATLKDPRDGSYFTENYDVRAEGPGGDEILIEYNSDADPIHQDSVDAIVAREAEGKVPSAAVFGPEDTEDDIANRIYDIIDNY